MHRAFRNSEKKEEFNVFGTPNCEMVNPVYYFSQTFQKHFLGLDMSFFRLKEVRPTPMIIARLKNNNLTLWQKQLKEAVGYELSSEMKGLYVWADKRSQIRLAENIKFDNESFFAFIIQAGDSHRFKYSRYITDHRPKELADKKYPNFIFKESDEKYITQGNTDLTFGQLKVSIEKRRRVIAEFLDQGENWHCFFRTLSSINGKEEPHIDEPHLHYLSSNWGIPREVVVSQLKAYRYKLPSVFIPFQQSEREEDN